MPVSGSGPFGPSKHEWEQGNKQIRSGKYLEAVESYTKALKKDKLNHILYGNRSQAYLYLNMPKEALDDCNEALKINPAYVKCYFRRGQAYKKLFQYEKAILDFKRVLELEESNTKAAEEIAALEDMENNEENKHVKETKINGKKQFKSTSPLSTNKEWPKKHIEKSNLPKIRGKLSDIPKFQKTCPDKIPLNGFEFMINWREMDNETRLNYLKKIGADKLPGILAHYSELDWFSEIFHVLNLCSDLEFVSNTLCNLRAIDRFDISVLFLENKEKQDLREICKKCRSFGPTQHKAEELWKIYQL